MSTATTSGAARGRRRVPLSAWIFAGLAAGLGLGAALADAHVRALPTLVAVATPIGRLWLNALTMTVVPLVFALLVTGMSSAAAGASAGGIARASLAWFVALLVAAAVLSAAVATLLLDLWPALPVAGTAGGTETAVPAAAAADWTAGLIAPNPIKAAAETAMVPIVVFAMLFGLAATRIAGPLRESIVTFFRAVVEAMLVIVHWVLLLAPVGVFALAFTVAARLGLGAAGALVQYVLVVCACCLAATVMAALVGIVGGRIAPLAFARGALPAQVVAVSTQSSLASLPAMIEAAPALGVERTAAGVVLPLAVSLFRVGTAAANIAVAVYLAHLFGTPPGLATLAVGALTSAAISLAAVGLPAQVSFFATVSPVCLAMGVPVGMLPLLLAVETIPDIFRTLGNVTADLAVTRLAGRDRGGAAA